MQEDRAPSRALLVQNSRSFVISKRNCEVYIEMAKQPLAQRAHSKDSKILEERREFYYLVGQYDAKGTVHNNLRENHSPRRRTDTFEVDAAAMNWLRKLMAFSLFSIKKKPNYGKTAW